LKCKCKQIPLIPQEVLSTQQKQIYKLYCQGVSNKDIALKLKIEQRTVATQLSRIRKKAANIDFTYKIKQGAEPVKLHAQQDSPAFELIQKIQNDPGFFELMFNKYATNEESSKENKYRLAPVGQNSSLLFTTRARQIKMMALTGTVLSNGKVVVKIEKKNRRALAEYFQKQKIQPVQTYWDDGSALYMVTYCELKNIEQLLNYGS